MRKLAIQIEDAFWDERLAAENRSLAAWILEYFQKEFQLAEEPHQLTPQTHAMLLNLRLQCAAIAGVEDSSLQRMKLVRQGLRDFDYPHPELVWLHYRPKRGLNFQPYVTKEKQFILVPYVVAPWDDTFYYALGGLFAYLLRRKRLPGDVRQQFDEAVRQNATAHPPVYRPRKSDDDLLMIYRELNETFFNGQLPEVTIRWSDRANKRKLGHWDAYRKEIVINPLLNMPEVPFYVLRSIVFHEMLHIALPPYAKNGRIVRHHKAFREAEKQFPDYHRTQQWIERHWTRHYRRYHR